MAITAKQAAKELIDKLPDNVTLNDIMYELYVKQKIESGMQASREGHITSHEAVKKSFIERANHL